jgi:nitrite reductase (NADH) large subunit
MNIVIIGNGIAGVSVAETIRASDKSSGITIITDEKYPFYSRPRLIEFLAGKATIGQITIHDVNWYEKNAIDLKLSQKVTAIDTAGKKVSTVGGTEFAYDKLVIAAGASCQVPAVPGFDNSTAVTLRTVDDAEKIRARAVPGKTAVMIGGGLLGIEIAASLQTCGMKVTVVEVFDRLLPRQLDHESSAVIQRLLEQKGMAILVGKKVRSVRQENGGSLIVFGDGKEIVADLVAVSTGIRPNCSLAMNTAINTCRGIVVDDYMRTTAADVYACGDVAEHKGIIYGLWQPAREQGMVCGSHILGKEAVYKGTVSSARLKVAGIDLASIGNIGACAGTKSTTEKDEKAGTYKKLFVKDNRLVGAVLIGNVKDAARLQLAIKNNEELSLSRP